MLMFHWPPATHLWQTEFHPTPTELAAALTRLDDFLDARQVAAGLAYSLRFIFEEIVTNTVKYGYDDSPAGHHIRVRISLAAPICIVIEDDGRAFDPVHPPNAPDLSLPVEERPIGGLGLYMVSTMAARMDYERCDNLNRLTIELPDPT